MKKIVITACLFYAATSEASPIKAMLTVAAPVLIPGTYYWGKKFSDEKEIMEKHKGDSTQDQKIERDVELTNAGESARNFTDGAIWGIGLPYNIIILLSDKTINKERPVIPHIKQMNADQKVGFFSGLSVYGTTAGLLSLLKKAGK